MKRSQPILFSILMVALVAFSLPLAGCMGKYDGQSESNVTALGRVYVEDVNNGHTPEEAQTMAESLGENYSKALGVPWSKPPAPFDKDWLAGLDTRVKWFWETIQDLLTDKFNYDQGVGLATDSLKYEQSKR